MRPFFYISKIFKSLLLILLVCSLTQCASYDFSKKTIEQGNLLPAKKINQLKPGMTKAEVGVLLGTSLLSPTFNTNRWDYAYTKRKGNAVSNTVRHVSVYFKNDRVTRIQT
jgi:outer membrane protein assembly factor BamE